MEEINKFLCFGEYNVGRGGIRVSRRIPVVKKETKIEEITQEEEIAQDGAEESRVDDDDNWSFSSFESLSDGDEEAFILTEDDIRQRDILLQTNDGVYEKYNFDFECNTSLPVNDLRHEILDLIDRNPIVIIQGNTGCGKTTQIPQYILDNAYKRKEYCKIIVTQPRRLSAISIAQRISFERDWNCGTVVGYKIGLHQQAEDDTRIVCCTTGVFLNILIKDKTLKNCTHIILDEIHECDVNMDLLLMLVRVLLARESRYVKLILMSATINTEKLGKYFGIGEKLTPVLRIQHRETYLVNEVYLDDLHLMGLEHNIKVYFEDPGISEKMYRLAVKLILKIDSMEDDEEQDSVNGSILIFLPGQHEIDHLHHEITHSEEFKTSKKKYFLKHLYSSLSTKQQKDVFKRLPKGFRKIILATNIAESSITVPDIKYVIDFCLSKTLHTDKCYGFCELHLNWVSRASCQQRAGRTGRVMNGFVYRLVPRAMYENDFKEFQIPEMLRCSLESVILKVKLLNMGSPLEVLSTLIDPPYLKDVHNAILNLKRMGALNVTCRGRYSIEDGDLTIFGHAMAILPVDLPSVRLILLGYAFSHLREAIIIAAGLSVNSLHETSCQGENVDLNRFYRKISFAAGCSSDLIAILEAYEKWKSYCRCSDAPTKDAEQHISASELHLNETSLIEMDLLIEHITKRLKTLGIEEASSARQDSSSKNYSILHVIIAGAFYPLYFIPKRKYNVDYGEEIHKKLYGKDPKNTVTLRGLRSVSLSEVYLGSVKELFSAIDIPPENMDVQFFEKDVCVTFKRKDVGSQMKLSPGFVMDEVLKAVWMRFAKDRMAIKIMQPADTFRYAENHGLGAMDLNGFAMNTKKAENIHMIVIPSPFEKTLRGYIVHVETCSEFYMVPLKEQQRLKDNHNILNRELKSGDFRFSSPFEVRVNMIVAAPYGNEQYYRVQVVQRLTDSHEANYRVKFLDYGNYENIAFQELRRIPDVLADRTRIPPLCFECRLANVQPLPVLTTDSNWHSDAIKLLQDLGSSDPVEIEVYSVVEFVASVVIKTKTGDLNRILIEKNYAQYCDESFLSMEDHNSRQRKQRDAAYYTKNTLKEANEKYIRRMIPTKYVEIEPPPKELCTETVKVFGPYTPLEIGVSSAIRSIASEKVIIDRNSINAILLDFNPQSKHEQLLVATSVKRSIPSGVLVVRSTSLAPNIPGFGALMTLLFARSVQLKTNRQETKFVTLLAGLGMNEDTGEPLHATHDIVMNLDVEISVEDLEMINNLRQAMNEILHAVSSEKDEEEPCADKKAKINKDLIKLLTKQRQYIEPPDEVSHCVWERRNSKDSNDKENLWKTRKHFPLHKIVELKKNGDKVHAPSYQFT